MDDPQTMVLQPVTIGSERHLLIFVIVAALGMVAVLPWLGKYAVAWRRARRT